MSYVEKKDDAQKPLLSIEAIPEQTQQRKSEEDLSKTQQRKSGTYLNPGSLCTKTSSSW